MRSAGHVAGLSQSARMTRRARLRSLPGALSREHAVAGAIAQLALSAATPSVGVIVTNRCEYAAENVAAFSCEALKCWDGAGRRANSKAFAQRDAYLTHISAAMPVPPVTPAPRAKYSWGMATNRTLGGGGFAENVAETAVAPRVSAAKTDKREISTVSVKNLLQTFGTMNPTAVPARTAKKPVKKIAKKIAEDSVLTAVPQATSQAENARTQTLGVSVKDILQRFDAMKTPAAAAKSPRATTLLTNAPAAKSPTTKTPIKETDKSFAEGSVSTTGPHSFSNAGKIATEMSGVSVKDFLQRFDSMKSTATSYAKMPTSNAKTATAYNPVTIVDNELTKNTVSTTPLDDLSKTVSIRGEASGVSVSNLLQNFGNSSPTRVRVSRFVRQQSSDDVTPESLPLTVKSASASAGEPAAAPQQTNAELAALAAQLRKGPIDADAPAGSSAFDPRANLSVVREAGVLSFLEECIRAPEEAVGRSLMPGAEFVQHLMADQIHNYVFRFARPLMAAARITFLKSLAEADVLPAQAGGAAAGVSVGAATTFVAETRQQGTPATRSQNTGVFAVHFPTDAESFFPVEAPVCGSWLLLAQLIVRLEAAAAEAGLPILLLPDFSSSKEMEKLRRGAVETFVSIKDECAEPGDKPCPRAVDALGALRCLKGHAASSVEGSSPCPDTLAAFASRYASRAGSARLRAMLALGLGGAAMVLRSRINLSFLPAFLSHEADPALPVVEIEGSIKALGRDRDEDEKSISVAFFSEASPIYATLFTAYTDPEMKTAVSVAEIVRRAPPVIWLGPAPGEERPPARLTLSGRLLPRRIAGREGALSSGGDEAVGATYTAEGEAFAAAIPYWGENI